MHTVPFFLTARYKLAHFWYTDCLPHEDKRYDVECYIIERALSDTKGRRMLSLPVQTHQRLDEQRFQSGATAHRTLSLFLDMITQLCSYKTPPSPSALPYLLNQQSRLTQRLNIPTRLHHSLHGRLAQAPSLIRRFLLPPRLRLRTSRRCHTA